MERINEGQLTPSAGRQVRKTRKIADADVVRALERYKEQQRKLFEQNRSMRPKRALRANWSGLIHPTLPPKPVSR